MSNEPTPEQAAAIPECLNDACTMGCTTECRAVINRAWLALQASTGPEQPPSTDPRCALCTHPKRDHDGRADHRARYSPLVAGDPWCHACNATCDYTPAEARTADEEESTPPGPTDLRARIAEAIRAQGSLTDTAVQEITRRVLPAFAAHMVSLSGDLHARADVLATQATELAAPAPAVPKDCCGRRIGHYPACRVGQAGGEPDSLRERLAGPHGDYAAALAQSFAGTDAGRLERMADAVLGVRDTELQQLREQLAEARTALRIAEGDRDASDEAARKFLARCSEMAAERYAWQERGDRAEAAIARVLHLGDTWFREGEPGPTREAGRLILRALRPQGECRRRHCPAGAPDCTHCNCCDIPDQPAPRDR